MFHNEKKLYTAVVNSSNNTNKTTKIQSKWTCCILFVS